MNEMKYVVVSSEEDGEQIFIFPKEISHDAFADVLSYIKVGDRNWHRVFRKPISAGFTDGKSCYGFSETLGMGCRQGKDDELLLGL